MTRTGTSRLSQSDDVVESDCGVCGGLAVGRSLPGGTQGGTGPAEMEARMLESSDAEQKGKSAHTLLGDAGKSQEGEGDGSAEVIDRLLPDRWRCDCHTRAKAPIHGIAMAPLLVR